MNPSDPADADRSRLARVTVSPELLREALRLPNETEIVGVKMTSDFYPSAIEFVLRHRDFDVIPQGGRIPLTLIEYRHIETRFVKLKEGGN